MDTIADVLLAFLLKINVPVSEAESLTDKVREKKVAELFENMEKMDIQVERRNTEEQRLRAEAAQQKNELAISLLIETCRDTGLTKDVARNKLMDRLGLPAAEAQVKLSKYWS